jgi:hypothetical protein
MRGNDTGTEAK